VLAGADAVLDVGGVYDPAAKVRERAFERGGGGAAGFLGVALGGQ
jgi:hypothetical protein